MQIPLDDHMVHRGDAVFEAFRCIAGAFYNLDAHLTRLQESAAEIRLRPPLPRARLLAALRAAVRAGGRRNCVVRVFFSRGPGSFSVNPRDCPAPQAYIAVAPTPPSAMARHPGGVRLKTCSFQFQPVFQAGLKSCNYLPSAMMQLEAVTAGADYAAGFDSRGRLAEGATENIGIITRDKRLLFPPSGGILEGTTMRRVLALAGALTAHGRLKAAGRAPITRAAFDRAAEIIVCGTSTEVAAAVSVDGRPVGDGRPGPAFRLLYDSLQRDMYHNVALRAPVWPQPARTRRSPQPQPLEAVS